MMAVFTHKHKPYTFREFIQPGESINHMFLPLLTLFVNHKNQYQNPNPPKNVIDPESLPAGREPAIIK
jgi:hypothetical protein